MLENHAVKILWIEILHEWLSMSEARRGAKEEFAAVNLPRFVVTKRMSHKSAIYEVLVPSIGVAVLEGASSSLRLGLGLASDAHGHDPANTAETHEERANDAHLEWFVHVSTSLSSDEAGHHDTAATGEPGEDHNPHSVYCADIDGCFIKSHSVVVLFN